MCLEGAPLTVILYARGPCSDPNLERRLSLVELAVRRGLEPLDLKPYAGPMSLLTAAGLVAEVTLLGDHEIARGVARASENHLPVLLLYYASWANRAYSRRGVVSRGYRSPAQCERIATDFFATLIARGSGSDDARSR